MTHKEQFLFFAAENTRIILHKEVFEFMHEFINHKQRYGSRIEQIVYEGMTPRKLVSFCFFLFFSFSLFLLFFLFLVHILKELSMKRSLQEN